MTRFARSKGSKASNERVEEEATPWEELKSTVAPPQSKKVKYNVEDIADDENFREIDFTENNVEKNNSEQSSDESEADVEQETTNKIAVENEKKVYQEKNPSVTDDEVLNKKKRKRSQNKCLNCKQPGHLKRECPDLSEERRKELQDLVQMKVERKGQGTGRKKNKQKLTDKLSQSTNESNEKGSAPQAKKQKKVLKDKTGQVVQDNEGLFQGFRVLKEDVQRLRDLHAKLEKGKISPTEIKEVLKKERRRAEKSLAKSIKNVCYQCRQPGHVLNDCPQLELNKKSKSKMGKCFKCGSADHTSKNCESKLKGADAYRFAECFVCKQTGHLAKTCPDNPKGLYPKGGGCRFCGSVEHLKSDCPRKAQKDAKTDVTAMKLNDHKDLEDEPIPSQPKKIFKPQKKQKVVSF